METEKYFNAGAEPELSVVRNSKLVARLANLRSRVVDFLERLEI